MIRFALLLSVLTAVLCEGQQMKEQEKCAVEGRVTSATTGEPLRKAYVRLYRNADKPDAEAITLGALTDAQGHFLIGNISPGSYRLTAERQGYVPAQYGATGNTRHGTDLQLVAGQKIQDLRFPLTPQGVITGRVFDEEGDVVEHSYVTVYRHVWEKGKRKLQRENGSSTNDQGEFRIAWLSPGRYYLSATPNRGRMDEENQTTGPQEHERSTYYPGALDEQNAMPIQVNAGQELGGMDIQLRKAIAYSIKGKVVGLAAIDKTKDEERDEFTVLAMRKTDAQALSSPRSDGLIKKDGTFEIRKLSPGPYILQITKGMYGPQVLLGRTVVELGNQNIDDVVIQVVPPKPVKGIVRIEGDPPVKPGGIQIMLQTQAGAAWTTPATAKEGGSFSFDQVGADQYGIRLWNIPEGTYLKSVRVNDSEAANEVVDLTAGAGGNLELTLSARGARIRGTIKKDDASAGQNKSNAPKAWQVVLIPDTQDTEKRERYTRTGRFDQYGSFTIKGIAPGNYRLFAWEDMKDDAWKNPEFLKEIESKGTPVSVSEGEQRQEQLTLISAETSNDLMAKLGMK